MRALSESESAKLHNTAEEIKSELRPHSELVLRPWRMVLCVPVRLGFPSWWNQDTFITSVECGVEVPFFSSSSSSKQQQASSTHEMAKNQDSVVVVQVQLKFWWMIPMSERHNPTKFEEET